MHITISHHLNCSFCPTNSPKLQTSSLQEKTSRETKEFFQIFRLKLFHLQLQLFLLDCRIIALMSFIWEGPCFLIKNNWISPFLQYGTSKANYHLQSPGRSQYKHQANFRFQMYPLCRLRNSLMENGQFLACSTDTHTMDDVALFNAFCGGEIILISLNLSPLSCVWWCVPLENEKVRAQTPNIKSIHTPQSHNKVFHMSWLTVVAQEKKKKKKQLLQ